MGKVIILVTIHYLSLFKAIYVKGCPGNCPWGKLPTGEMPPGWLAIRQLSSMIIALEDNWSLDDCPQIISLGNYPKDNCPQGKLPFEWFVAHIIAPWTNGPKANWPRGKLPQG